MAVVSIYNQENQVVGDLELPENLFGVKVRPEILHQVVRAHLAARRQDTVRVKNRTTIQGGGKKPWRQKGTGRARAGSVRSPLWKGGAVAHGPQGANHKLKVNKKVKKMAMKMALSSKLHQENLLVVEKFVCDNPKTKEFIKIQQQLDFKKALIVLPKKDNIFSLACRNVQGVKAIVQDQMNVYDVLKYPYLIITPEVVQYLQERLQ